MVRTGLRWIAMVMAVLSLAGAATAADEVKKRPVEPRGFYGKFLAPRMASRLNAEISAAAEFANPAANPWTRDDRTIARIEKTTFGAARSALKRYAIESLGIDRWSVPLFKVGGRSLGDDSSAARLRFGISHMAPRAEVLIPVNAGRVAFSADTRGCVGTSFDSATSNFRVGVFYDAPAHAGTFSLSRRF